MSPISLGFYSEAASRSGQLQGGFPPLVTSVVNDLHEPGGSLIGMADSAASDWPVSITSMARWRLWPLQAQRFHLQLATDFAVTILASFNVCSPWGRGCRSSTLYRTNASNVVAVVTEHLARPCGNLSPNLPGQTKHLPSIAHHFVEDG